MSFCGLYPIAMAIRINLLSLYPPLLSCWNLDLQGVILVCIYLVHLHLSFLDYSQKPQRRGKGKKRIAEFCEHDHSLLVRANSQTWMIGLCPQGVGMSNFGGLTHLVFYDIVNE